MSTKLKGAVVWTYEDGTDQGYYAEAPTREDFQKVAEGMASEPGVSYARFKLDDEEVWTVVGIHCEECCAGHAMDDLDAVEAAISRYFQDDGTKPQPAAALSRVSFSCGNHGVCVFLYNVNGYLGALHNVRT